MRFPGLSQHLTVVCGTVLLMLVAGCGGGESSGAYFNPHRTNARAAEDDGDLQRAEELYREAIVTEDQYDRYVGELMYEDLFRVRAMIREQEGASALALLPPLLLGPGWSDDEEGSSWLFIIVLLAAWFGGLWVSLWFFQWRHQTSAPNRAVTSQTPSTPDEGTHVEAVS